MLIIGLTGSIAMGKSTACAYLADKGLPVFSADEVVHELYSSSAVPLIEQAFPGTTKQGKVDRDLLSSALMDQPDGFDKLEALIHPLVREQSLSFVEQERARGSWAVILDIPLLFEKQLEHIVDVIVLVTAPPEIQRRRVMKRVNMSVKKFKMIRAKQMDDVEKRQRADFVVDTNGPYEETHAKLDAILESLHDWPQRTVK